MIPNAYKITGTQDRVKNSALPLNDEVTDTSRVMKTANINQKQFIRKHSSIWNVTEIERGFFFYFIFFLNVCKTWHIGNGVNQTSNTNI